MAAQLELALDNLEAIITAADMTLANIVTLNVYTTDVDAVINEFQTLNDRFGNNRYADLGARRRKPPSKFLVMLEATAVD